MTRWRGPPRQLPARRRRPAHSGGYLVERHPEDVVQDKHDPLGRGETLQHDEQRQPDAVVEGDPIRRIGEPSRLSCYELDLAGVVSTLAACPGRPDQVKAKAARHDDQPSAHIFDLVQTGHRPCAPPRVLDEAALPNVTPRQVTPPNVTPRKVTPRKVTVADVTFAGLVPSLPVTCY